MAVSFVAGTSASNSSAVSLSVNKPSGVQADDVLVVIVHHNTEAALNDNEAGFTFVDAFQENNPSTGGTSRIAIFTRVITGSDPTSYQFTSDGAASRVQISAAAFRGVDTASIWDVAPSASTRAFGDLATTDPSQTPSMSTSNADAMGIVVFLNDSARTWSSPTQSYTNEVQAGTAQEACAMWSKQLPSSGSQAAVGATLGSDTDWVAHQFALKPAVTAPNITDVANSGETPGSGTETWDDGSTGNVITGTGFI